jgi:hydrophobic/amphiphilic exporter-1 (mainly G- bacteria), HAE1 family
LTASALALLDISKTTARDALNVLGQVQAQVKAETDRLPSGIKLSLTQDAASVARGRLNLLVTNGLQGLALVFAILWLFFSMRYGFWVAMGLPVSFLGGLFVLGLMGVSLNVISMVGLLIAVGLLMDDAIVIAENVARALNDGASAIEAAASGAPDTPSRFKVAFERARDHLLGRALNVAIRQRHLTLGIVMMLILISIAVIAGGRIGFVGFPNIEGDIIEVRILPPQGTPLERTEAVIATLDQALLEVNAEFKLRQRNEADLVRHRTVVFGENPDAYETGPHVARIAVDLLSSGHHNANIDEIVTAWRARAGDIADAIAIKFAEPSIGLAGRAIDIRLHGDDMERLQSASRELRTWMRRFDGVVDLGDDLHPGKREYRATLKHGAGALRLDSRAVVDQMRGSFQGITADEFPVGAESFEASQDRANPNHLYEMMLVGKDGKPVPLSTVADITEQRGWARIHRVDGQRTVTVQGDVDTRVTNAQSVVNLTESTFLRNLQQNYPDVRFSLEGENKNSAQTSQSLFRNVLLGLVGVYLIVAFQFRSYLLLVGVMLVIPTALLESSSDTWWSTSISRCRAWWG